MTGERDRFVDLLRAASMVGVVVGHWLVADVRWDGRELAETSALAEAPSLWPLSWMVLVIALFFFVGGFANAQSWRSTRGRGEGYASFVGRRTHRMLVPLGVFLGAVLALGVVVERVGGSGDLGAILLQPLWFLGVYLLVIGLVPLTWRWHRRWGVAVPVALLLVALGVDILVFGAGLTGVGYVNAVVVWVLVHQLGYFYADDRTRGRVGAWLAVGGWSAAILLTQSDAFPYSSFMVGVTGVDPGNMHPPTLALMAVALAAVGTALWARPVLVGWARRPRVWRAVATVNASVLTIYLWHETALLLAARLVLPLGYPTPTAGSAAWWVARLVWLLVPAVVLALIVAVAGRAERVRPRSPAPASRLTGRTAAVAVVLLGLGLLALAGSTVTRVFDATPRLGPVMVSVALGLAFVLSAAGLLAATRHGDRASRAALVGAAGLLVGVAAAHAVGAGPVPAEPVVAWTAAVPALGLLAVALVPAEDPSGDLGLLSDPSSARRSGT